IIVIVKIAEAIPTLNPYCIASEVTRVGSSIFAILFPIKMVVMNSLGLEIKSKSFSAFLSLLSTFVCSFILLVAVNAVSLPEKKNETNNNMKIAKIINTSLPLFSSIRTGVQVRIMHFYLLVRNLKGESLHPPLIIPLNILFLYIGRTKHLRIDLDLGTVNFQTISLHSLGNISPFNDWVPIT